jgi:hypothetical protein
MNVLRRLRELLFGHTPMNHGTVRRRGAELLTAISDGDLERLRPDQLVDLTEVILTIGPLRKPLHGNTRFLQSVCSQYRKKGVLSPRQRRGMLNILQKAYPHNLAVDLRPYL